MMSLPILLAIDAVCLVGIGLVLIVIKNVLFGEEE